MSLARYLPETASEAFIGPMASSFAETIALVQANCPSLASLGKHEIVLQMHGAGDSAAAAVDGPAKDARFRVLPEAWPCTSTANLPLILISSAPGSRNRAQDDKADAAPSAPASATTAGSLKASTWVVVDGHEVADGDLREEAAAKPESNDIPVNLEAVIATITESMTFTEPFVAPAETSGVRRRGAMRSSARRDSQWETLKTNGMVLGC